MDDFIVFDPGVTQDFIPARIMQLRRANNFLTVVTIVALFAAIYYSSRCPAMEDEYSKV